ncbi:hypothetical protein Hanom_Chr08g00708431 [Helianthus anomalus]
MHEEYEDAKYCGRYDKKRDCYINKNGDPVLHRKEVRDEEGMKKNVDKLVTDLKKVAEE